MSSRILNELLSELAIMVHPSMEIITISGNVFHGQLLQIFDTRYLHMTNLRLVKSDTLITPEVIGETLVDTEKIQKVKS